MLRRFGTLTPFGKLIRLPVGSERSPVPSTDGKNIDLSDNCPGTKRTSGLLQHVRVNAIANFFEVLPLKDLANAKISRLVGAEWSANGFLEALHEAGNTAHDNVLMRILSEAAAVHIEELVLHDSFTRVDLTGEYARAVLQYVAAISKARQEQATSEQRELKTQLESAEKRIRALTQDIEWQKDCATGSRERAERIIHNFENCAAVLNETYECRNTKCNAEFRCWFERGGKPEEPQYTLRCVRCRCRHR